MSQDVHDNHGQTPAAWTGVTIIMLGFIAGCLGVVLAQPWIVWVSVGVMAIGLIVGKAMSMMGYGAQKPEDSSVTE